MSWAYTAIAAGTVISAAISSNSANRAADAQKDAANASNSTQMAMYNQTRKDQEPWRNAGAAALNGMQENDFKKDFSQTDFQADPG